MSSQQALFPVFLKLAGRRVLVVGGGPVAAAKIAALRPTGARITVVAPEIDAGIDGRAVRILRRGVRARDVAAAFFVVSAATPAVNRRVARMAERRRVFVNAVDDPANATAYLGGVLRRNGVTIAVSTSGRAPALAGLLREGLDALLPRDLNRWLTEADRMRRRWQRATVPMPTRRPQLLVALSRLYARGGRATALEARAT